MHIETRRKTDIVQNKSHDYIKKKKKRDVGRKSHAISRVYT